MTRNRTTAIGLAVDYTRRIPLPEIRGLSDQAVKRLAKSLVKTTQDAVLLTMLSLDEIAERTRIPSDVLQKACDAFLLLAHEPLGRLLRMGRFDEPSIAAAQRDLSNVRSRAPKVPVWEQPELPLPKEKLRITATADFTGMLLSAVEASGLPKKYVAEQAGLSRSQLYRLIDTNKAPLPRQPQQIRALLEVCFLPEKQVTHILEQWHELNLNRYRAPLPPKPDAVDELQESLPSQTSTSGSGPQRAMDGADLPVAYLRSKHGLAGFGFTFVAIVTSILTLTNTVEVSWALVIMLLTSVAVIAFVRRVRS